eukprot:363220-Chlamydomonas_euryale.AAC.2
MAVREWLLEGSCEEVAVKGWLRGSGCEACTSYATHEITRPQASCGAWCETLGEASCEASCVASCEDRDRKQLSCATIC